MDVNFVTPIIVTLKANQDLGEGVVVGGAVYMDFDVDEAGAIKRDENKQPIMIKKRDTYVVWEKDRSQFFVHQMDELSPVEVVAVRTYQEMKQEILTEVVALIDTDERIDEVADRVVDKMAEEEEEEPVK